MLCCSLSCFCLLCAPFQVRSLDFRASRRQRYGNFGEHSLCIWQLIPQILSIHTLEILIPTRAMGLRMGLKSKIFGDFANGSNLSNSLELEEGLNCSSAHTEFPLTLCSPKVHQGKPRGEPHQRILCCLIPEKEDR